MNWRQSLLKAPNFSVTDLKPTPTVKDADILTAPYLPGTIFDDFQKPGLFVSFILCPPTDIFLIVYIGL